MQKLDRDRFRRPTHQRPALGLFLLATLLSTTLLPVASMAQDGPDRSGFTMLLNLGVGFQRDQFLEETNTGLAGLNLGLGGFLNPNLALMFRASGTNVSIGPVNQISGTGALSVQYWPAERFNFEAGVGFGFWDIEGAGDEGLGLVLATSYAFWSNGKHNLYVGAEFAPVFADPDPIYNMGLVFGWQLL